MRDGRGFWHGLDVALSHIPVSGSGVFSPLSEDLSQHRDSAAPPSLLQSQH